MLVRENVRDLASRYAVAVDSGDFEAAKALFAPHATMDVQGDVRSGPDEIVTIFTGAGEDFSDRAGDAPIVRHNITTHTIDVLSDSTARARLYFMVIVGDQLDHWGRYFDEIELVDGTWLFVSRKVRIDGSISGDR